MEDDKDDDFMCMRVDGGKTIAIYKGVTVVASRRTEEAESQNTEAVKPQSLWRRLLKTLKLS